MTAKFGVKCEEVSGGGQVFRDVFSASEIENEINHARCRDAVDRVLLVGSLCVCV